MSSTVTVTDAVPSGIEIEVGLTRANPVTPSVAVYAGCELTGVPETSSTWIVTTTLLMVPGAGSAAETTRTCTGGPEMKVTVPGNSARDVADVSVRLTETASARLSLTVIVVRAVPSRSEMGDPATLAAPLTPTVAE